LISWPIDYGAARGKDVLHRGSEGPAIEARSHGGAWRDGRDPPGKGPATARIVAINAPGERRREPGGVADKIAIKDDFDVLPDDVARALGIDD